MNIYQEMKIAKDECYTTRAESDKLISYLELNNVINKDMLIWLPFDNELSNIYKSLENKGYKTTLSSLELGLDFYTYEPKDWDIIITNPPFSGRSDLMKRLVSFNKPFIILQATQFFNNQTATKILCDNSNDFKFIMPESRMGFLMYNEKLDKVISGKNGTAFYSFWLCYKTLLKNTFNYLENSGKEKEVEEYDIMGNVIKDNHYNLFNILNGESNAE